MRLMFAFMLIVFACHVFAQRETWKCEPESVYKAAKVRTVSMYSCDRKAGSQTLLTYEEYNPAGCPLKKYDRSNNKSFYFNLYEYNNAGLLTHFQYGSSAAINEPGTVTSDMRCWYREDGLLEKSEHQGDLPAGLTKKYFTYKEKRLALKQEVVITAKGDTSFERFYFYYDSMPEILQKEVQRDFQNGKAYKKQEWAYNRNGNMTRLEAVLMDGTGTEGKKVAQEYRYDPSGRIIEYIASEDNKQSERYTRQWDGNQYMEVRYLSNNTVRDTVYDRESRLDENIGDDPDKPPVSTSKTYRDKNGNRVILNYSDGVQQEKLVLNPRGLPIEQVWTGSPGQYTKWEYTYYK